MAEPLPCPRLSRRGPLPRRGAIVSCAVDLVQGTRVLVTGAGGFIGGHLTAELVRRGAHVRAFLRYNSRADRGTLPWFGEVTDEVELVFGDLRDLESVAGAVRGMERVFHLAAQIAIPYSYVNPRDFFETNVLGTLNVAQSALSSGVEHLVHTSTSEVYGTAQTVPITESHPLEAQSPYAASKIGADKLIDSYHRTHELPTTVIRPFNTYGPHQSARAIIPTIVTQALSSTSLRLGSLDPRRDLTFVLDTADAMIRAAFTEETVGRTVQLGTGHDVSVREIVELVGELLGHELQVKRDEQRIRPPASEVMRLISDPSLARELMGWEARVSLRDGLSDTIGWIRANAARYRADVYAI
jgi:NAD dependent epimerase/dehydratase